MPDGLLKQCKTCVKAKQKAYREGLPREARLEYQRRYTAAHREQKHAYDTEYRRVNREQLLEAKRAWYQANRDHHAALGRAWREANAEQKRAMDRAYHVKYRDELLTAVFGHYGQTCACCGASQPLSIDHVDGDGAAHRMSLRAARATNVTGQAFYLWLVRNSLPEGYQTLCLPCNASKGTGKSCQLDHENPERRTRRQRRDLAS